MQTVHGLIIKLELLNFQQLAPSIAWQSKVVKYNCDWI